MKPLHVATIALLVVVTHVLWLGPNGNSMDEEFFAVQAAVWGRGGPPGVGTWDVAKTPGIALVYLAVFALGGESLVPVHIAVALCVFGIACALYGIAARFFGRASGLAAAVLFVAAMQTFGSSCDTKALTTELVASLLVALAVWLLLAVGSSRRVAWGCGAAGLLCGGAVVVRQTSVLFVAVLLVTMVLLVRGANRQTLPLSVAALVCGLIVPAVGLIGYYTSIGALHELWMTSIAWPLKAGGAMPLGWGVVRGAYAVPHFFFIGAPLLTALAASYYLSPDPDPSVSAQLPWRSRLSIVTLWLAAALVAVMPSMRFHGYYFVQMLPPLCLAAGGGLAWAWAVPTAKRLATCLVAVAAVAASIALNLEAVRHRVLDSAGVGVTATSAEPVDQLIAAVREHSDPEEPIFLWGDFWPEAYWRTGCLPAARDLFGVVTAGYSFTRGHGATVSYLPDAERILVDDLTRSSPECIVDLSTSPTFMGRMRTTPRLMGEFPLLYEYVQSSYRPTPGPAGSVIYLPAEEEPQNQNQADAAPRSARTTRTVVRQAA